MKKSIIAIIASTLALFMYQSAEVKADDHGAYEWEYTQSDEDAWYAAFAGHGWTEFTNTAIAHYDELAYDEIDQSESDISWDCGSVYTCRVVSSVSYSSDGDYKGGYNYWQYNSDLSHHYYIRDANFTNREYNSGEDVFSAYNHNIQAALTVNTDVYKSGGWTNAQSNRYYDLVTYSYRR